MKCPRCGRDCSQDSMFCQYCGHHIQGEDELGGTSAIHAGDINFGIVPGNLFASRYRIIEEIGRGGMGRIYKAEDLELGTVVALKAIRPEYLDDDRMIRRFKKEILLAREVSHPNVVRIHDFGEAEGVKFITMQYVDGENLRDLIRDSGPLGLDAVISVATQLLEGLAAAHEHNILHRDLKPPNIMVNEKGDVVITDFGLAKSLMVSDGSLSGTLIGTPQYIPPEQWRGQSLTAAADIYAVGVILFEMLTGHCPFQADSDVGYLEMHIHRRPKFTKEEESRIPLFLRRLVMRCLEKRPKDRYPDVETLLSDLRLGCFTTRPLRSRVSDFLHGRWMRIAAVAAIAAAVTLGVVYWWQPGSLAGGSGPTRQSLAVLNFENETGEEALDRWRSALPDLLITDLAQSRFLRMIPENRMVQVMQRLKIPLEGPYAADNLKRLGESIGVNHFITGSFARAGDRFRVNLRILEPNSGEILYTESASGTGEGCFFPMVDELTRKVKVRFGFSPRDLQRDIDREIGKITTTSPEAMKFYIMGQQQFRKGRFPQSLDAYRNAIRMDPEFALAYRAAAESCGYMENEADEKEYIRKALTLLKRVSHREQLMIQGYAANAIHRDFRRAAQTYASLLKIYPEDDEANIYMGAMLRNLGEWEAARKHFLRVLEKSPDHQLALVNLLYISRVQGDYGHALRLLHEHGSQSGEPAFVNYWTSVIMTCQNRLEEARLEIRAALKEDPENPLYHIQMGNLCQLVGDGEDAETRYRRLLDLSDRWERVRGFCWLARLRSTQGRFKDARNLLNQGLSALNDAEKRQSGALISIQLVFLELMAGTDNLPPDSREFLQSVEAKERDYYTPRLLMYRGLYALQDAKLDLARAELERLRALPESFFGTTHLRFRFYLAARIAEAEGDIPQAVKHLESALSYLENQVGRMDDHAFFFHHMARLYRKAGLRRKAIEFSRRIEELNFGRLRFGRIFVLSRYLLARDYHAIGWEGKALECYRDFLGHCRQGEFAAESVRDARIQVELLSRMTAE